MVNWNDPATEATQLIEHTRLQYALGGVYFWEILTNLPYDWRTLTTSPSRGISLVKWIYLANRYLALGGIVSIMVFTGTSKPVDCRVLVQFCFGFSFFAIQFASLLIGIRVLAIWNFKRPLVYSVAIAFCVQSAFFIRTLTQVDGAFSPEFNACGVLNADANLSNITVTLVVDIFLLVLMLTGLMRWKGASRFGLWKVLWGQGLVWLTAATIAEVPSVVFLALNLNEVLNLVFFTPEFIILAIAATRMYRTLSEYTKSYRPNEIANPRMHSSIRSQTRHGIGSQDEPGSAHLSFSPRNPAQVQISSYVQLMPIGQRLREAS